MDLSAYLAIFLDESRENLQALNQHLLALEDNPGERSHLDAIFRVAHTLKGMSATMGFQGIADLTHKMEELLDHLRTGKGTVDPGVLDTLFLCLDTLEAQVECAATGTEPADASALVDKLKAAIAGATAATVEPAAAQPASPEPGAAAAALERPYSETEVRMVEEARRTGYNAYELLIFLMPGCLMKSLRVTLVMRALEPLGTVIRTVPTVAEMEADAMGDSFRLTFISIVDDSEIRAAVMGVAEIAAATIEPVTLLGEAPAAAKLLDAMLVLSDGDRRILAEAAKQGLHAYAIEVGLEPGTMLKSARAIMAVRQVETRGELIRILPSAEAIEQEAFGDSFAMLLLSADPAADLTRMLKSVAAVASVQVQSIDPVPVPAPASVAAVAQVAAVAARPEAVGLPAPASPAADDRKDASAQVANKKAMATIRVDTEKLDELMNLMGELVISRTRLNQLASHHEATEIMQAVQHLTTITTDLQTVAMKLRMVSIEHVFNRFPRMVRDLGRTLSKDIELTIIGQDTELDRSVIDMIGDPLVHLIRNSADHGLESTEERVEKGKPATGRIRLEAKQEGGMVVVSVEDDGRGMDAARIRQKAIDKKVITPEAASMMDEWEALQLIFAAGFSTRDVANEVSGRGVGLDAVKELVNQMGGLIELSTNIGHGSRFAIKLPLTLAIMQALLTRVQHEIYAIPLAAVEEAVSITADQIKRVQSRPVMILRGETIPLIHLTDRLDVPANGDSDAFGFGEDGEMPVVIVNSTSGAKQNQKTGLVVSTLIGQEEIVIKPLSRTVRTSPYIAGAATLGDGSIALILNTPSLG
jgi:two-component system chemotaxis sensor kinase CheA